MKRVEIKAFIPHTPKKRPRRVQRTCQWAPLVNSSSTIAEKKRKKSHHAEIGLESGDFSSQFKI